MSLDAFSSAVQQVYAAAADPTQWKSALAAVEELTGSTGAVIGFVGKASTDPGFVIAGRFTEEQCAEYAQTYMSICRRTAFALRHSEPEIQYDALVMSEREMDRDPVYEFFARQGVRYYIGSALPDLGRYRCNLGLQRSRAQGHVQRDDIELYAKLVPHIAQALTLSNMIGGLAAQRRFGYDLLHRLPHGVLALDTAGRVIFANMAAETILAEHDGLDVVQGSLAPPRSGDAQALRRLVGSAVSRGAVRNGGWLRLPRPSGRIAYSIFIAPLEIDAGLAGLQQPAALVAIFDPEKRSKLDPEMLRGLYNLSLKEAQVATLIAAGLETTAICIQLGISLETVRTHLKSIYRKMEVSRQQDIVGVLASLSMFGSP